MKGSNKLCLIAGVLLTSSVVNAGAMGEVSDVKPWFASIGTGYSWTNFPGIQNPNPNEWDFSAQGYDGFIGNRGFLTFALGKQVNEYVDLSLMYMQHENFNYQDFQSGNSATPDFTGSQRNRFFTLNNKAVLLNGFLHADKYSTQLSTMTFTPYIGAGIGYAYNYINNFYTVGNQIQGAGQPNVGSTDSIGSPTGTSSFAWQGTVALNTRFQESHLSLNTGYRYFDGGNFNGPTSIYTNANGFVSASPWSGRVKANQVFAELQYTI